MQNSYPSIVQSAKKILRGQLRALHMQFSEPVLLALNTTNSHYAVGRQSRSLQVDFQVPLGLPFARYLLAFVPHKA